MSFVALAILLQAASPAGTRTMTLQEAIDTALRQQPQLVQARAQTEVAMARADEARAPLLPQVNGSASYQLRTTNQVSGGPQLNNVGQNASFAPSNFWNFGVTASQVI